MSDLRSGASRAVADVTEMDLLGSVELPASPERVFRALASKEITKWWVRAGVFDTREWTGDVRVGGRWHASGIGRGNPYVLEGEFTAVEPPRKLVHTWKGNGASNATVIYHLEKIEGGTRVTVRHSGFDVPEVCMMTAAGWETSLDRLLEILSSEKG
jgi:uncharacterized protein YndB with AHSA1/START domain